MISVPLGFFGGIGAASKVGVLVKGSNYLEAVAEMTTIVFDKTGTLTKGEFKVSEILPAEGSKEELLEIRDIGPTLALNIYDFFRQENNQKLISDLKELGLNTKYLKEEAKENSLISDKRFVITGTISFLGRDEIEAILESYNGHPSSSVSSNRCCYCR